MLERALVESGSVCEREDVPAECTLHERHVLTRHKRRKSAKQRVDAKREVATPFSFPFSFIWFMCKCVWEAPVGGYNRAV